ncbi:orotidine-5'-phosphate decarboxylase [Microbacterium sp. AK031]|uniref:orotidine-5'-phosphate decarboxylase n=1 Tax=Microbacterium sp. AK031 TaxID=2723076 RepID=UPI00216AA4AE|nr:orotidine-5'-phosphate decarboxylase [Microbacterium sp. AK031]MCS3842522.1 orotidine-5'-phosphate decarboxylase [Microbacterium sp. AK031]
MSGRFGERIRAALSAHGPLCVGIDPHRALLASWGLDDSAAGAREFGLRTVDAAAGRIAAVKPQVSFFERFGSAGFAALEEVLAAARAADLVVIADAKRGDIDTTMDAYAAAWLTPGSPLEADALTVNPFLGVGALESTFALAEGSGKGVFVLAATSNPEASAVQRARSTDAQTVSAAIIDEVSSRSARSTTDGEWASLGFVIGATVDWTDAGIAAFTPAAPILGPGFGAQGAGPGDLLARFGTHASMVIASESRSILSAGPDALIAAIDARAAEYREALNV